MTTLNTVELKEPITRGKKTLDKISLREPRAGELRGLELMSIVRMDVNSLRILLPRISELNANEVDQLHPADLTKLASEVTVFLAG
ncbi:phage tail assembly protein [Spartinivicinus poritis]|uniref:Phage tail assembly protein n=1 Tax=Spartinivicinus poritis TaxID=2994640 RepID=A0ABT5UGQ1_9GAMM|nr:phage tail assembly protein [Spartinivicinus sp. A2-2]MDE1465533.1 phage tail assembly protein [Spartinivicinus sp. A2-2]